MFDTISEGRWWDKPWSLVEGCTPCSPGCDHCWLQSMDRRFHRGETVTFREDRLAIPVRRRKPTAWAIWSDLFHENVRSCNQAHALDVIRQRQQHIFLVLTKRPKLMAEWFGHPGAQPLPPNLWVGTTVCNQAEADEKVPHLLRVPAAVRFLSIEPMLGPVNFRWTTWAQDAAGQTYQEYIDQRGTVNQYEGLKSISWVICGGESGPGARPMHPGWVRGVRDQCWESGVPFFFKQWGEFHPQGPTAAREVFVCERDGDYAYTDKDGFNAWVDRHRSCRGSNHYVMRRVGRKAAGRLLDGRTWDEMPEGQR